MTYAAQVTRGVCVCVLYVYAISIIRLLGGHSDLSLRPTPFWAKFDTLQFHSYPRFPFFLCVCRVLYVYATSILKLLGGH